MFTSCPNQPHLTLLPPFKIKTKKQERVVHLLNNVTSPFIS